MFSQWFVFLMIRYWGTILIGRGKMKVNLVVGKDAEKKDERLWWVVKYCFLLQFKLSQQFSFTSPQLWHPILMLPHVWPWPASSWNQMFKSFLIRWFKKFRLKQSCFCSRVQYIAKPTARVDNVQDYSSRSRMAQTARDPGPSSQAWTATNPGCSG